MNETKVNNILFFRKLFKIFLIKFRWEEIHLRWKRNFYLLGQTSGCVQMFPKIGSLQVVNFSVLNSLLNFLLFLSFVSRLKSLAFDTQHERLINNYSFFFICNFVFYLLYSTTYWTLCQPEEWRWNTIV